MTVRFSNRMVPELAQAFWAALQAGEFVAGTHRWRGLQWLREVGGVRPRRGRDLQGRYLSFAEREEIAVGRAAGESVRCIAAPLGRSPSTVSRELARNAGAGGYRATSAHALAYARAARPKPAKLATNVALRQRVEQDLAKRYSPEQIAGRLRAEFPTTRRGGCRRRRSISRCTCSPAARCAVIWPAACAPAGRCATRAGSPGSARTASPTWSTSPSDRPRPLTGPCPATGRATSSSARTISPRSARWSSARRAT